VTEAPPLPANFRTAMLSDCLDEVGRREQVMQQEIRALRPGMRCAGPAATVQFAPTTEAGSEPYDDMIDFLSGLQAGTVAVVATAGSSRSGYWGELFSAAALGRGVAGVVCDGPLRDSDQIEELGFPAFAPATRPIDYRARMRVVGAGQPVLCGGVVVQPGDLVVADADGVVVVPTDVAAQVVDATTERATREDRVRAELLGGATLRHVWETYRTL
jgi:4-hydroxy-4-methyl-2-oxoglutarate aldolase